MNKKTLYIILLVIGIVILLTIYFNNRSNNLCTHNGSGKREHYRDPIWPNKVKMYNDWYTRSNGSIYGNEHIPRPIVGGASVCCKPWDMFNGYPTYPKAY